MIGKVRGFFTEVATELKKVSWSTRQELIESTWVVIISSALLGFFISGIDLVLSRIIGMVIR
ncbi:MAG: preprotein translocase subunit SecE [candidate division Zixibacteria bacterium]|nr:preprotein translocase subunit SecE [candidate division Zixibacteria bacterium]